MPKKFSVSAIEKKGFGYFPITEAANFASQPILPT